MGKSKCRNINLLFLGMLFCHLVLPYVLSPFLKGITYYTALLLAQVLLQFPVMLYLVITGTNPAKLISFKFFHPGAAVLVILMTYCVLPLTSLVNLISMLFVDNALTDLTVEISGGSLGLNLLFIAIIPALSEEFAFRGVMFHTLKKHGKWFGVVLSALFFGMMHLNFNQFSYTFVIGMVMALAVLATGSLWGSVLVHLTLNANSVIMMKLLEVLAEKTSQMGTGTAQLLEEGAGELATADLLLMIAVMAVAAAVMLIPAGSLLYCVAHLCHRTEVLRPMFFGNAEQKHELPENVEAQEVPEQQHAPGQRKILDVFFVLCLIISFGYMIYLVV